MNKKTVKNYTYTGLGFPVVLHDIEMVEINGEYCPKINVKKISSSVIKSLVLQKTRLTGNQIKFVRSYFSMSLREFSKVVNESHMSVKKWENFKNAPTNMDSNIEIMLRLNIYKYTMIDPAQGQKQKMKFYEQFSLLTKLFSHLKEIKSAQPLVKHVKHKTV